MRVVGLMSGTSIDGVDVAAFDIQGQAPALRVNFLKGLTIPYSADMREQILQACDLTASTVQQISRLNMDLGEVFAQAVAALALEGIDLIASHGQTLWHEVEADGRVQSSLQIGEASVIAARTGITTIHNFRARDIALGGQGAPLTAYVDYLLLRHPSHWRAVQNIGGMGNVTLLPPRSVADAAPLAFDTGPGNALIDAAVFALSKGEKRYDEAGALARQGNVDGAWLEKLLQHPYFERHPPKTTGRERFGSFYAQSLLVEGQTRGLSTPDIVATLSALTVYSIRDAYTRFAPQPIAEVVVGGGGAHNPVLMQGLRDALPGVTVETHEALGLNSDYKEAMVFAVLAYESLHLRVGNHPALTGAEQAAILGQITPGENFRALLQAMENAT